MRFAASGRSDAITKELCLDGPSPTPMHAKRPWPHAGRRHDLGPQPPLDTAPDVDPKRTLKSQLRAPSPTLAQSSTARCSGRHQNARHTLQRRTPGLGNPALHVGTQLTPVSPAGHDRGATLGISGRPGFPSDLTTERRSAPGTAEYSAVGSPDLLDHTPR